MWQACSKNVFFTILKIILDLAFSSFHLLSLFKFHFNIVLIFISLMNICIELLFNLFIMERVFNRKAYLSFIIRVGHGQAVKTLTFHEIGSRFDPTLIRLKLIT